MATYHWNLAECSLTVAGYGPLSEFADGDAISISFSEDDWAITQGHNGAVVRSKKPNAIASATVIISYGSAHNDVLSDIYNNDKATGLGTGFFNYSDTNGRSQAYAETSWITKAPDLVGKTEQDSVSWPITLSGAEIHIGGNRLA